MSTNQQVTNPDVSDLESVLHSIYLQNDDYHVYYQYSGRGMYGETCIGLVGSDHVEQMVAKVVYQLCQCNLPEKFINEVIESIQSDNMGFNTIIYFVGYDIDDPHRHHDDN